MAFPTTPITGQIAVVDGISYVYNASYNSWKRQTVTFTTANTISNSAIVQVDTFVGTGTQTTFTLSVTPPSKNYISVTIDGATQLHSAYTLVGNILTLSGAPYAGENIEVTSFVNGSPGIYLSGATSVYDLDDISYKTDGFTNTFPLNYNGVATGIGSPFNLTVTINGILQPAFDYKYDTVWLANILSASKGYCIDTSGNANTSGYIKFANCPPQGSQVLMRTVVGTVQSTYKTYPFKPLDVLMGY
jgi:hypothetical protein